jgi:hypothetical protein
VGHNEGEASVVGFCCVHTGRGVFIQVGVCSYRQGCVHTGRGVFHRLSSDGIMLWCAGMDF